MKIFITAKIHRATVTDANVDYPGSITLCPELIKAAGLLPNEFVHINNVMNGNHWETYVVPGNIGDVVLNGPPAHLFKKGDVVVINRLEHLSDASQLVQRVVHVNDKNAVTVVDGPPTVEARAAAAYYEIHSSQYEQFTPWHELTEHRRNAWLLMAAKVL